MMGLQCGTTNPIKLFYTCNFKLAYEYIYIYMRYTYDLTPNHSIHEVKPTQLSHHKGEPHIGVLSQAFAAPMSLRVAPLAPCRRSSFFDAIGALRPEGGTVGPWERCKVGLSMVMYG